MKSKRKTSKYNFSFCVASFEHDSKEISACYNRALYKSRTSTPESATYYDHHHHHNNIITETTKRESTEIRHKNIQIVVKTCRFISFPSAFSAIKRKNKKKSTATTTTFQFKCKQKFHNTLIPIPMYTLLSTVYHVQSRCLSVFRALVEGKVRDCSFHKVQMHARKKRRQIEEKAMPMLKYGLCTCLSPLCCKRLQMQFSYKTYGEKIDQKSRSELSLSFYKHHHHDHHINVILFCLSASVFSSRECCSTSQMI